MANRGFWFGGWWIDLDRPRIRCFHPIAKRTTDKKGREICGVCGSRLFRPEPAG